MTTATTTLRQLILLTDGDFLHTTGEPDPRALSIFPQSVPAWDVKSFAVMASNLAPGDSLITRISLNVQDILCLDEKQRMLAAVGDWAGEIIVHGAYNPETDSTVDTFVDCQSGLAGTTVHILSQDFFRSFADTAVSEAWNIAMRLLAGFTTEVNFYRLASSLRYARSAMFDEITWIGRDHYEPRIDAHSIRGFDIKTEEV